MAGYLPPVIVRVLSDSTQFRADIEKDKALLLQFARDTAQAHLGLNQDQFRSGLVNAKGELLALTGKEQDVILGLDTAPFLAGLAKAKAEAAAMSSDWVKISGINSALANWGTSQAVSAGGGGGSGGFLAGLLAGKGGGGKKGPGLLSLLGFGGAGGLLGLGGLASWGSIGSFAGLGAEHLLMTGVGLAGNAVGGMLGGGLLGLGSLGVGAVGMGTDMAGMGQAANDIKAVYAAQNQLNDAIAVYGQNSRQAAIAQAQLNNTLNSFSPIARSAVLGAANTAQQFHDLFNQATGQAEKVGAEIITQAMQVGEKFLPTIGKYAAENMGIIQGALQPLFSWMQGPGLQIFTNLEQKFQSDLPTAMTAFDNGIELLMKTVNLIAPQTGGFIKWLAKITTEFNGPKWGQWSAGVNKLIGDFRSWEGLIKILVADIYQLFHADAGTATSIVGSLTQMLTKLHAWETSTSGQNQLHNLFETHKQEILQILKLLPTFISAFGKIEMTVAPQMTKVAASILKFVNAVLKIPGIGKMLAWGVAIGIVASRMKLLSIGGKLFSGVGTAARDLGLVGKAMRDISNGGKIMDTLKGISGALRKTGVAAGDAALGEDAAAYSTGVLDIAMGLLATAGIVAVIIGLYELIKHWKAVWGAIKTAASAVWGWLKTAWKATVGALKAAWSAISGGFKSLWSADWKNLKSVAGTIWDGLKTAWHATVTALKTAWDTTSSALKTAWHDSWNAVKTTGKTIWDAIKSAWSAWLKAVKSEADTAWSALKSGAVGLWHALDGTWHSIQSAVTKTWNAIVSFIGGVPGRIARALGSLGSKVLGVATTAWRDFKNGVANGTTDLLTFVANIPSRIIDALGNVARLLFNAGESIMRGFLNGIESGFGAVGSFVSGIAGWISNNKGPITADRVLLVPQGQAVMAGFAQGLQQGMRQMVEPLITGVQGQLLAGMSAGRAIPAMATAGAAYGASTAGTMTHSASYVINVTAPSGNGQDIARTVKQALQEHDREQMRGLRSGSAYG